MDSEARDEGSEGKPRVPASDAAGVVVLKKEHMKSNMVGIHALAAAAMLLRSAPAARMRPRPTGGKPSPIVPVSTAIATGSSSRTPRTPRRTATALKPSSLARTS